jgi:hypothetical protein
MSRLRHPLRAIREPFGTAGLIVAMIALIAALGGTALAAKSALTGKQRKEVEKIAKHYAGHDGAAGKDGRNGKEGPPGAPGSSGASGQSAKGPVLVEVAECAGLGGLVYEVPGSGEEAEVCDGKDGHEGKDGKEGSPWTAGGTLPPGATETGTWAFDVEAKTITTEVEGVKEEVAVGHTSGIAVPISFPIPFPFFIKNAHVHFVGGEGDGEACPGTVTRPKATRGELCIYETAVFGTEFNGAYRFYLASRGATSAGSILAFEPPTGHAEGNGSFAVTSCTEKVEEGLGLNECESPEEEEAGQE